MGSEVDQAFVQALEHRPGPVKLVTGGISLIDLSALSNVESPVDLAPEVLSGLVEEIESASRDWGFFQVINHGVPVELRQKLEEACKEFFALPLEEKRKVRRDESNPLGYYDTEHTKNVRDWKEVFDFTVQDPTVLPSETEDGNEELQSLKNQWPEYPSELRKVSIEYARGVEKLVYKLLELLSLSLGLPADRLNGFFKDQTSFIRFNHYPPCPIPDLALGVGRHKDAGALTVLYQDEVGGLEVKRKADGEWIRVKPIPDTYVVNVGDIIQVWSNEKYESVEHRVVVNSEKERFSIPYFFNPAHYVMVKPLDELVDEQKPPKYREYNWGNFFKTRKNSNFKKLDVENIQIYHFKTAEE
ncbi:protein LATERAL BRANCHING OXIDOREDUCTASE 1-like [Aristolochia californica]|uniref:protein LATERAL BRANCHING OXIDOREDUCTASE 1-like n=1 Tax=Aristolochia californica TaxID=171875 RepID=UPI0035D63F31